MVDVSDWHVSRTRSPSAIPDDGIRGLLEEKTAYLFATQLQTRLNTLRQTREIPKFLRRNSYNLYLDGHFALLDPRDLARTTLSPTPPSSEEWTSADRTPEPTPVVPHYNRHSDHTSLPRPRTLQSRIGRKPRPLRAKRDTTTPNMRSHRMLRRSRKTGEALLYELEWVGRNTVTVCQLAQDTGAISDKQG